MTIATSLKTILSHAPKSIRPAPVIAEESLARYGPGGYHPVRIGDVFHNGKYKVARKLGYGVYSTVWLARDLEARRHVALKVLTADSFGHQQDSFELDILRHIRSQTVSHPGSSHILGLLDNFEHRGPHGNHVCLVFEPMGPDMSYYGQLFPKLGIPLPLVKRVSRQLLLALSYLHDTCRVIHTDIKPQNIMVETPAIKEMFNQAPSVAFEATQSSLDPPNDFYMKSAQITSAQEDLAIQPDVSVRLADFGTSSWFDNHLTEWIQPHMLRAPEVILGAAWDHKVDIWNLGCIIWELAEGQVLFDGTWSHDAAYSAEAHLAQMSAVFGRFPTSLLARSKESHRFFDADGNLLKASTFPSCSLGQLSRNSFVPEAEKKDFLSLVESMVRLDPEQRPDAKDLLASEWLGSDS